MTTQSLNRRRFLAAASLGAGLTVAGTSRRAAAVFTQQEQEREREQALGRWTRADLPTPALVLDLDAFEANVRQIADHCKSRGCAARPHAKTHKCAEIARRQVDAGARGVAVATVPEAEAMVRAGINGVLLTSPIVERGKIARMVGLAKKGGGVMLAVGHPREAELLAEAAEAERVRVDVLVDLDVGDHRFGITPGTPARELARQISRYGSLRLRGVQAYAGLASHVKGFDARKEVSRTAMTQAVQTKELLSQDGHDMAILSGGSTGTYNIDCDLPGGIELQVGSYVFMDVQYRAIGGRSDGSVYNDFRPSLTVLTTVVSTTLDDRVSLDAGVKSFATESPTLPEAKSWEGLRYKFFGDEFGQLTAVDGGRLPRLGDRLEFYVPHCDPTVNLYDRMYAMRGDTVEAIWPIVARKETGRIPRSG
jgi:D-serine deaminase-like pyridoxal phosphate-dependent protein